jgi:hypothetical protein
MGYREGALQDLSEALRRDFPDTTISCPSVAAVRHKVGVLFRGHPDGAELRRQHRLALALMDGTRL